MYKFLRLILLLSLAAQLHGYDKNSDLKPTIEFSSGKTIFIDDIDKIKDRAAGNDLEAEFILGVAYELGSGVPVDGELALSWLKKAADAGYAPAMNRLGLASTAGGLLPLNAEKAAAYFRQASQLGNVDATNNLAVLLEIGSSGVPRDLKTAAIMFEDAASRGCAAASYNAGVLAETGPEPDPEKAFGFYFRSAEAGDVNAMLALSLLYWDGKGTPADKPLSIKLLQKAADAGSSDAMVFLGEQYMWGHEIAKDLPQGLQYFKRAADLNNAQGEFNAASAYELGLGTTRNPATAAALYEKCSDRGMPACMINLARLLQGDAGVPKDLARSFELVKRAAELGVPVGINNLALRYYQGRGVPKDDKKALETIRKLDPKLGWDFRYRTLGLILGMSDDPAVQNTAESIRTLEEGVQRYPSDINMRFNLVDVYVRARQFDKAVEDLDKIAALNSVGPSDISFVARKYEYTPEIRDLKKALALAQQAEELNRDHDPYITEALANALNDNEQYEQSLALMEKIAAANPDNPLYLNDLAWQLVTIKKMELRNPQRALDLANKALAIDGSNSAYIDTLAETYFVLGDVEKAIETEKRAIALAPDEKGLQQTLARYQKAH